MYLPSRGDIFRNTGNFISFTTLRIYIVTEDFESKELLFTEENSSMVNAPCSKKFVSVKMYGFFFRSLKLACSVPYYDKRRIQTRTVGSFRTVKQPLLVKTLRKRKISYALYKL